MSKLVVLISQNSDLITKIPPSFQGRYIGFPLYINSNAAYAAFECGICFCLGASFSWLIAHFTLQLDANVYFSCFATIFNFISPLVKYAGLAFLGVSKHLFYRSWFVRPSFT